MTQVMNKPISCVFVFSVVYCVVFRQKQKILGKNKTNKITIKEKKNTKRKKTRKREEDKRNLRGKQQTTKSTGHPAHRSAANKYLSGSGWISCILFLLFSRRLFSLCLCLLELFRLYMQKLKKTAVFSVCLFVCLEGCLFLFVCILLLLCCYIVFLSCCMYKRNNFSKNKKTKHFENNNKQKYSSSSRNLRDVYSLSSGGLEDVLLFIFSRSLFKLLHFSIIINPLL